MMTNLEQRREEARVKLEALREQIDGLLSSTLFGGPFEDPEVQMENDLEHYLSDALNEIEEKKKMADPNIPATDLHAPAPPPQVPPPPQEPVKPCYLINHQGTWYIAFLGTCTVDDKGQPGGNDDPLRAAWYNRDTDGMICLDIDEPDVKFLPE